MMPTNPHITHLESYTIFSTSGKPFFFLPKMGFKCYLSIPMVLETNGSNAPGMCVRVTSRVLANNCQLFPTL